MCPFAENDGWGFVAPFHRLCCVTSGRCKSETSIAFPVPPQGPCPQIPLKHSTPRWWNVPSHSIVSKSTRYWTLFEFDAKVAKSGALFPWCTSTKYYIVIVIVKPTSLRALLSCRRVGDNYARLLLCCTIVKRALAGSGKSFANLYFLFTVSDLYCRLITLYEVLSVGSRERDIRYS